ncbi:TPA: hypothetical protein DF272_05545 [Candidatus Falkowbacteria bacterium]|nr:hypothetical protein [Candidatus Falkowbacteria bacterium]
MKGKLLLKGAVWGIILGTIGGYLFNAKTGKQNRGKLKTAAAKLGKRLTSELDQVSDVTKKHYDAMVNKVVDDLKKDKTMSREAWDEISKELKSRWAMVNSEVKSAVATKVKKSTTKKKK